MIVRHGAGLALVPLAGFTTVLGYVVGYTTYAFAISMLQPALHSPAGCVIWMGLALVPRPSPFSLMRSVAWIHSTFLKQMNGVHTPMYSSYVPSSNRRRCRVRLSRIFIYFRIGTPMVGVLVGAMVGESVGGTVGDLVGHGFESPPHEELSAVAQARRTYPS